MLQQSNSSLGPIRPGSDGQNEVVKYLTKTTVELTKTKSENEVLEEIEQLTSRLISNFPYKELVEKYPNFGLLTISKIFDHYNGIRNATYYGHLLVSRKEFVDAYEISLVSQLDPRVAFKRDYLIKRLLSACSTQFQYQSLVEVPSETSQNLPSEVLDA